MKHHKTSSSHVWDYYQKNGCLPPHVLISKDEIQDLQQSVFCNTSFPDFSRKDQNNLYKRIQRQIAEKHSRVSRIWFFASMFTLCVMFIIGGVAFDQYHSSLTFPDTSVQTSEITIDDIDDMSDFSSDIAIIEQFFVWEDEMAFLDMSLDL